MEPAAPGTEDEAPSISKKERERLLLLKAWHPYHQRYGNVFEISFQNGRETWYCNICDCPVMGRVFHHEIGKRHTSNMQMSNDKQDRLNKDNVHSNPPATANKPSPVKVAPGEPVPPGFESEMKKVAQIQERIDNFKSSPILGLEYLLELQDYDLDKEPSYLCLLCGKRGDPRTVIAHLISYNHLQAYLLRHYPKTYAAVYPYSTKTYKKCWQDTLNKIAEAIEFKYGRLTPHPVDAETYERRKQQIYEMVNNGPHFSESNGVTFEHLVDRKEFLQCANEAVAADDSNFTNDSSKEVSTEVSTSLPGSKSKDNERRRSLSSVSSTSSLEDFNGDDPKKRKLSIRSSLFNRRKSRSPYRRRRSKSRSPYRRKADYLPWNRPDYIRKQDDNASGVTSKLPSKGYSKMDEFKRLSGAIENDLEGKLKQHKMHPEKHPQYNEEWKIFWNKRYKELQQEGKDTAKYDFKPEWIVAWNKRCLELHKEELKKQVDALRKRLGLPSEAQPISFKINMQKKKGNLRVAPVAAQPDQDHEVIVIDDKEEDSHSPWETESLKRTPKKRSRSRSRSNSKGRYRRDPYTRRSNRRSISKGRRSRSRSRSHSKSTSVSRNRRSSSRDRGARYRRRTRSASRSPKRVNSHERSWERDISAHIEQRHKDKDVILVRESALKKTVSPPPELTMDSGDVSVVPVLRLLTAVEDKLGSLGPKVVEMLAAALALEKKQPNSSEDLLDEEVNCVMFETIKEKLKGLLHAGLVPYNQEKAIKMCVTKIASLLHMASTRKEQKKVETKKLSAADKAAIAKQIATALVIQGKTDVTESELEQYVKAVVEAIESSKDTSNLTATFLEILQKKKIQTVAETKVEEKVEEKKEKDAMDGLSDSDLQTLLQNFKDLSAEEQHGLIGYLKKMESKDPARVETLRKFVNLSSTEPKEEVVERTVSPFSRKLSESGKPSSNSLDGSKKVEEAETSSNKDSLAKSMEKIDSDDDDYTYEDVFKAASKNVEDQDREKKLKEEKSTEEGVSNLIANIMVSLSSKNSSTFTPPVNSTASSSSSAPPNLQNLPVKTAPQLNPQSMPHQQQQQQQMFNRNSGQFLPGPQGPQAPGPNYNFVSSSLPSFIPPQNLYQQQQQCNAAPNDFSLNSLNARPFFQQQRPPGPNRMDFMANPNVNSNNHGNPPRPNSNYNYRW